MADDVYLKLRAWLDRFPGGFPATDKGVEIKILKKLFRPEDAEMMMCLTQHPETVSTIAERCRMSEKVVSEKLKRLDEKGLVFRIMIGDEPYYTAMSFLIGFLENQVNTMDREFFQLMVDYWESDFGAFWARQKQLRVVPVSSALDPTKEVATYDDFRETVRQQDFISVRPCMCRRGAELLGKPCSRPLETEIAFGFLGQFAIENGTGREISVEEALKILDEAEEAALVLAPINTKESIGCCMCCDCCCFWLRGLKKLERPAEHVQSPFQATIDPDLCTNCGACLERCQMEAILEEDQGKVIDLARCIGCGLCRPSCPEGAIALVPRSEVEEPPATLADMFSGIAARRGVS